MTKRLEAPPDTTMERRSAAVIAGLERVDPEFVLYLPSSTLRIVLDHFLDGPGARPGRCVFPIPREEEGVSILAGLGLARRRSVMIFQDNGIGNLLTTLLTFPQPYHVPIFGVVARRGGPGEYNSMIHTISERTEAILDAAGVRWVQYWIRAPPWTSGRRRSPGHIASPRRPIDRSWSSST